MAGKSKQEFEDFYNQHFDKIYRYVYFRVGANRALAEDLVSEVFLKALEHFDSYDPARGQSAWIFTIASNHLKNYWRDHKPTEPLPGEALNAGEEGHAPDKDWLKPALAALEQQLTRAEVTSLVAQLESLSEREIVTFHYILGYNYKEIADQKGMSESAVKVAAHRALKKLRQFI
ncbi:MAG: RNA polymerase sigma factor [Candidatus Magasanikbacteria bacterium]|nr:RNA polymerase sigma factor [Candidatus Magasanikbacteria bacterium]